MALLSFYFLHRKGRSVLWARALFNNNIHYNNHEHTLFSTFSPSKFPFISNFQQKIRYFSIVLYACICVYVLFKNHGEYKTLELNISISLTRLALLKSSLQRFVPMKIWWYRCFVVLLIKLTDQNAVYLLNKSRHTR